jgi:hypothetical protein
VSAARAKGTLAERLVVEYLREQGWPSAERRALSGNKDRGDVTGTPGLVWEVKSAARITLPEWLRETETERGNAQSDFGILVVKPKGYGVGRIGEWPAIVPLWAMTYMLGSLGYGSRKLEGICK